MKPPSSARGALFLSWARTESLGTGWCRGEAKGGKKNIGNLALTLWSLRMNGLEEGHPAGGEHHGVDLI